jgi:hypothetical protein
MFVCIYLHINLFLYPSMTHETTTPEEPLLQDLLHTTPGKLGTAHGPCGSWLAGKSPSKMEGSIAMMLFINNWVRKSWENHDYN